MAEDNTKAFNEVRALLGKLDRSIDEARNKRVGPDETDERPVRPSENNGSPAKDLDREVGGTPAPKPLTPLQQRRAQYGRARPLNGQDAAPARPQAKPLNKPGQNGSGNGAAWQSPKNYDDLSIG